MSEALLDARGIALGYPRGAGWQVVLGDFELRLGAAEVVSILGPSGAGKSSLLRVLVGLQEPAAGVLRADAMVLLIGLLGYLLDVAARGLYRRWAHAAEQGG